MQSEIRHKVKRIRSRAGLRFLLTGAAGVLWCLIVATVVIGLRLELTNKPPLLGNSDESLARAVSNADANDFTFLVVGDTKGGTATFEGLLTTIGQDKPAFAVVLGDFVAHATKAGHEFFAMEIGEYAREMPIFLLPGNHDVAEGGEGSFDVGDYTHLYGTDHFNFTIGRCMFICLNDCPCCDESGGYLDYLEQTLAGRDASVEKTLVFMHVPPGELHPDIIAGAAVDSERFLELAAKYQVDYVFCGDHHGYVKAVRGPTTFIITGGGGAKLRGEHGRFHHGVRMQYEGGRFTETVICQPRRLETVELAEHNLGVYVWPVIAASRASEATTAAVFVVLTLILMRLTLHRRRGGPAEVEGEGIAR